MAQPEAQELGAFRKGIRSDGSSLGILRRRGANSDCTIFFVHGAGGRAGQFRHQIEHFARKVNVVAFDFLGHGVSDKPEKADLYNADNHLYDLISVFERYKTKINHIVAHCYGSIHTFRFINWLYEQNRVKEVSKVAMIATSADAPETGGIFLKLPSTILEWTRPLIRSSANARIFHPGTDPALITYENSITNHNPMFMMRQIGRDIANGAWTNAVEQVTDIFSSGDISVPQVLLIHGALDGIIPIDGMRKLFGHVLSKATVCEIEDAAHLPMLEKPAKVNESLDNFLFE